MEFSLADSRTGEPFKERRATRKAETSYQKTMLERFFRRLGWRSSPGETPDQHTMKEVTITIPCVAGGKPRKKGEVVALENLKAAELIAMKCAEFKADIPTKKLQPWERLRPDADKKKAAPVK